VNTSSVYRTEPKQVLPTNVKTSPRVRQHTHHQQLSVNSTVGECRECIASRHRAASVHTASVHGPYHDERSPRSRTATKSVHTAAGRTPIAPVVHYMRCGVLSTFAPTTAAGEGVVALAAALGPAEQRVPAAAEAAGAHCRLLCQ